MAAAGTRLGVDFGTSNTVAVLARADGRVNPLLVDGQPQLPSAVCATPAKELLVGRAALHTARLHPDGYEPNPKRRIDDGFVLLGAQEYEVVELFAAVLRRVADETRRVTGSPAPDEIRITHPAVWGGARRDLLRRSAVAAGWPVQAVGLVPEPVAAAAAFAEVHGARLPVGGNALVYDLGGGTFDATVLRRTASGYDVRATDGLVDAGGLDIDHAILTHVGAIVEKRNPDAWRALTSPTSAAERRARWLFQDDVRGAKELLSSASSTLIPVPLIDDEIPVTRNELDALTRPLLERTISAVQGVLREATLTPGDLSALFLVGGSTRIPLVATLLHRTLGVAPTVLEQPELIVAEGALRVRAFDAPPSAAPPSAQASAAFPAGAQASGVFPAGAQASGAFPAGAQASAPPFPAPRSAPPHHLPPQPGAPRYPAPPHGVPAHSAPVVHSGPPFPPHGANHPGGWRPGHPTMPYPEPQAAPGVARGERDFRSAQPAPAPFTPPHAAAPVSAAPVSARPYGAAPVSGPAVGAAPVSGPAPGAAPVSGPAPGAAPVSGPAPGAAPVSGPAAGAAPVSGPAAGTARPVSAVPVSGTPGSGPSGKPTVQVRTMHQPGESVEFRGHDGPVSSLVISPDSTRLATAGADRTVRIWDLATGRRIVTLTGHTARINGIASSPDGSRLASVADDRTVRIWNPGTGTELASLTGHTDMIRAVAFHRDGLRVATGSFDHTVRLWDTRSGATVGTLTGHSDVVRAVAFHPDGRRVVTGSFDQTVRIWDVDTGQQLATLSGHGLVHAVAFSPDGRILATAGVDGTARLWEADNGRPLGERLAGHSGAVTGLAFRPDSRALATAGIDGTARLWNVVTGRALTAPIGGHTAALTSVAFSPDARTLVTGSHDTTARVHPL